jgi:hypothetical protein
VPVRIQTQAEKDGWAFLFRLFRHQLRLLAISHRVKEEWPI